MQITPQDENGIVVMILRDTYNILTNTPNFSFDYSADVKLQKTIFLIAERLGIPLTRSWYRHGPYVFNKNIDFETLRYLPAIMNEGTNSEIAKAEHMFSEIHAEYEELLNSIVPRLFFMKWDELLTYIYGNFAPELYKPAYFANLHIETNFKAARSEAKYNEESALVHTKEFTKNLSVLASNVTCFEDMSFLYDYVDEFATILDNCLIRMNAIGRSPLAQLTMLIDTYESAIWNPIALKISINTLDGVNAENERISQCSRIAKTEPTIKPQLTFLNNILSKNNMLASIDEKTEFFKEKYGNDDEFVGAVGNVWKSYK